MTKPTLQEIEEAIRTLTNAGMLLSAEQSIIVNRVCRELKQQENDEFRAAEALRRQEQEAQHKAKENAQRAEHERPMAKEDSIQKNQQSLPQNISLNDLVPYRAIWNALNDRRLRTAYKKHLYASGMKGSICTTRMADLSKKLKEIEENSQYKAMVQNCRTFAEMHKIFESLIISWGQETIYDWRKKIFHDFLDFILQNFELKQDKDTLIKESIQDNPKNNITHDEAGLIELEYSNGKKRTLKAIEALKEVVNRVGVNEVYHMNLKVDDSNLILILDPLDSRGYIRLNSFFWIKSHGTADEILDIILNIIRLDRHRYFKGASIKSEQMGTAPVQKVDNNGRNEEQIIIPSLFPKESNTKNRRQVELVFPNGSKQTLDPFDALRVVILKVGCDKVDRIGIQVGRTKLLRNSPPFGSINYIQLNKDYWIQNRGTAYEIFTNILKIIDADHRIHIKDVSLKSPNNA